MATELLPPISPRRRVRPGPAARCAPAHRDRWDHRRARRYPGCSSRPTAPPRVAKPVSRAAPRAATGSAAPDATRHPAAVTPAPDATRRAPARRSASAATRDAPATTAGLDATPAAAAASTPPDAPRAAAAASTPPDETRAAA